MPTGFLTIGEVAKKVGVDRWRLAYLIERGKLPPPSSKVPGRRLFSPENVERIRKSLEQMRAQADDRKLTPSSKGETDDGSS